MQILQEAKARMQRITYGRALAELALIRLSLLEDLESLEQLAEQLRNGNGPNSSHVGTSTQGTRSPSRNAPSPPVPPSQRPSSGGGESGGSTRDVRNEAPNGFSAADFRASDAGNEPTGIPTEMIPPAESNRSESEILTPSMNLEPGSEMQFWMQVISQITDMLRDYAKCVENAAISGPNHLVLTFRRSYDLQRQMCEKPSNLSRLEKTATAIAGRPIRISTKSIDLGPEGRRRRRSPRLDGRMKRNGQRKLRVTRWSGRSWMCSAATSLVNDRTG